MSPNINSCVHSFLNELSKKTPKFYRFVGLYNFGGEEERSFVFNGKESFSGQAFSFIQATGVFDEKEVNITAKEQLNIQDNQVSEECEEFIQAYHSDDEVEMVDGLVDILFTLANFQRMNEAFEIAVQPKFLTKLGIVTVLLSEIDLITEAEDQWLVESAKEIAINNRAKYTHDIREALSWEIKEEDLLDGITLHSNVVGSQIFYCLKDKNGKVRKHKNFKRVDLKGLKK